MIALQVTGFVCLELIKLIQRGGKAQFKDLQVVFSRISCTREVNVSLLRRRLG
jgi:hypothetical protein